MPSWTLRVLRRPARHGSMPTQSVAYGIPTRSVGTSDGEGRPRRDGSGLTSIFSWSRGGPADTIVQVGPARSALAPAQTGRRASADSSGLPPGLVPGRIDVETRSESRGIMPEYTNGHSNGHGNGTSNGHSNGNGHARRAQVRRGVAAGRVRPAPAAEPRGRARRPRQLSCSTTRCSTTSSRSSRSRISTATATRSSIKAIRDLYDLGKAVDAITLIDELTRKGEFEKAGGDEIDPQGAGGDPLGGQRQVLRPDRQAAGRQPRADRGGQPDPPRRLLEQLHGRRAAPVGRAADLRHRRGPGLGRDDRDQGRDRRGHGPDLGPGPRTATPSPAWPPAITTSTRSPAASPPPSSSSWPPAPRWARRRSR